MTPKTMKLLMVPKANGHATRVAQLCGWNVLATVGHKWEDESEPAAVARRQQYDRADLVVSWVDYGQKGGAADWAQTHAAELVNGAGVKPWVFMGPTRLRRELEPYLGEPWLTNDWLTVWSSHRPELWYGLAAVQRDQIAAGVLTFGLRILDGPAVHDAMVVAAVEAANELVNHYPCDRAHLQYLVRFGPPPVLIV